MAIEFGFGIIHWDVNKNSGIQVDQYLCILLCVRVCVCAYTSVLGQTDGLMDTAYAATFTAVNLLLYMYIRRASRK